MLPPEYREGLCAGNVSGASEAADAIGAAGAFGAAESAGAFWLTCFYGRLVAYLPDEWEIITEQLSRIRFPSPKLSHFKTKIMGLAEELTPDSQGRVRIPQALMREAGLHKDVMLVGMLNKFEIWDQARFDALTFEDVSEELAGGGVELSL